MPYSQSSVKLPVILSPSHLVIQSFSHLVTWSLGHSVTQSLLSSCHPHFQYAHERTHNIRIYRSASQTNRTKKMLLFIFFA